MIVEIPTRSDLENYSFRCDLDDRTFVIEISWNRRAERYFISLFDVDENPLVVGKALTISSPLYNRYSDPALPQGTMFLLDTSETNQECGKKDLGNRCLLLYSSGGVA